MSQVINDIFTILGGVGVVLSGLFIFFGKLQLERFKKNLENTNTKLKAVCESSVHVTKSRFDKEFEIYQLLWESLVNLKFATLSLRPALDQKPAEKTEEEIKGERLKVFAEANNKFVIQMQNYQPFYSNEVNESLEKINSLSRIEAISYQYKDSKDHKYWEEKMKNQKEILAEIESCSAIIRLRVDKLSVIGE